MTDNQLTILYIGFDNDSDVWPITNFFFLKYWSTCPYKKIFVSVNKPNDSSLFEELVCQGDGTFSSRLRKGLEEVNTPFLLVLLHDYWLCGFPSSSELDHLCDLMGRNSIDFLQLGTMMETKLHGKKTGIKGIRKISQKAHYRLNLQQAIWRTDFLKCIVAKNYFYSSWDFEVFFMNDVSGREISRTCRACFTDSFSFPIVNGLEKGKICYQSQSLLRANGIAVPNTRLLESKREYFKKHRFDKVVLPNWLRLFIKSIGRCFGHKYFSK